MHKKLSHLIIVSLILICSACANVTADASRASGIDELKKFSQVLNIVERFYVEHPERRDLIDGALKGMLQSLDPHSDLLTDKEFKDLRETSSGQFFGIGVEISMQDGRPTVVSPIEDTPAFKAGLKAGDVILSIDEKTTLDMSLLEVVSKIRGTKGTTVKLSMLSKGSTKPKDINIMRDQIPLISVKSRELEDGYYWIRLTRFSEKTTDELEEALNIATSDKNFKGIVLDLRNNPGGLLNQAVSVSDAFLTNGVIVSMRGRSPNSMQEFSASAQSNDIKAPIVVLINPGSASASEIVAGALKDHGRALIIGERSFGKGSVQNIIPLSDGSGIKLTVATYYTPSGDSIQAEGVVPDVEIEFIDPEGNKTEKSRIIREGDLNRHIEVKDSSNIKKQNLISQDEINKIVSNQNPKSNPASSEVKDFLAKDNQLRMGLEFVKNIRQ